MSINVNDKNLGHATAYAYYKAGGGTMTEAEFTEFMADFGTASQTAVEAAQAALASKNAAQTAATTATNKASEATTAATTATTKAGEASTSASTATSAKDTAVSASQTATSKATEATTAAATATSAATTATTAKDDAVSAKTAAQTAQTGAETAAASVQSSAAQIATNTSDITELKEDLTLVNEDNSEQYDLIPYEEWGVGTIGSDGEDADLSGFFRTDYIKIPHNSTLNVVTGGNAVFVFEYKADKSHINTNPSAGGTKFTENGSLVIRPLTQYVRLVIRKEPLDTSATMSIINNSSVTGAFLGYVKNGYDIADIKDYLNASVSPHYLPVANVDDMVFEGYINSTNGLFVDGSTWRASDYIDVDSLSEFITSMSTFASANNGGLAFYNSEKTYISGVAGRVTGSASFETVVVSVPSNAKYVRLSFRYSDIANFFAKYDEIDIMQETIREIEDWQENHTDFFGLQMFEKIGVIGNSISVGWAKDKNGNNSRRNTGISWVQQMARRLGCTAYNLGASGVDPIEWFQSDYEFAQYCYTQYQSVEECDLYIVCLGLNQCTLGTISDVNQSDYTQNGATFYGQYARIIQMINAEHPNAIVMCFTEPTTAIASYDQAVRNICALSYINAELVDLDADYRALFTTPEIVAEKQPDGLHYTPYGYSLIAKATIEVLNDYIAKNSAKFKYVGVESV